jgi:hypothetical protein
MKTAARRTVRILLVFLVLIIIIRLLLPYAVLHYANKTLNEMDGYRGHVNDIDIALIRGAYTIDSIYLNKYDSASQKQTTFFGSKAIELSVEWRSLFKGSIVGEMEFLEPTLRFTKDKVEPDQLKKDSTDFIKLLEDFMPLKVNRFEVHRGKIQYIDATSKPKVDVTMTDAHILALNLRNAYDSSSVLPATITADAKVYGGTLDFEMKMNPLAVEPTFDLNAELKNTDLPQLNDFFQAYAKVDVNKGTFGLYTEVAAKNGKFKGYVKPILKDLDVLGKEDRDDNIFRKLWEGMAGSVAKVFENRKEDQVATKIPFEGDIDNPRSNIWYTIVKVFQNAFIRALQPSIEGEINIAAVDAAEPEKEKKGIFKKIFGGKDKEEKTEEKKK